MQPTGMFEYMSAHDDSSRVAGRKALALARARATKRFSNFLAVGTAEEREARLALVAGDVSETVKQACADADYDDWQGVLEVVSSHLGSTVESVRRPKMCPVHREITDVSLQQGDPQAGYTAMGQHMFGESSCRGSWEEGRCNFKPEMVTQSYWDAKAEKAEERKLDRQQQAEQMGGDTIFEPVAEQPDVPSADTESDFEQADEGFSDNSETTLDNSEVPMAEPVMARVAGEGKCSECSATTFDGVCSNSKCPRSHDDDRSPRDARTAEALETVDVTKGGETAIPKMDKGTWVPENAKPIDTEMSGSPHPTVHQDIVEPLDWEADFKEQTKAVTETQDVEKSSNPTDGGGESGSWSKSNGVDPVTSARLSWGDQGQREDAQNEALNPGGQPPQNIHEPCPHCMGTGVSQDLGDVPVAPPQGDWGPHANSAEAFGVPPIPGGPPRQGAQDPERNPIMDAAMAEFPEEDDVAAAIQAYHGR